VGTADETELQTAGAGRGEDDPVGYKRRNDQRNRRPGDRSQFDRRHVVEHPPAVRESGQNWLSSSGDWAFQ
jgi:hypothetical protein